MIHTVQVSNVDVHHLYNLRLFEGPAFHTARPSTQHPTTEDLVVEMAATMLMTERTATSLLDPRCKLTTTNSLANFSGDRDARGDLKSSTEEGLISSTFDHLSKF